MKYIDEIIAEAYSEVYGKSEMLTEKVHADIQKIMNDDNIPAANKLSWVSKKAKSLMKNGSDTGLESATPKKGSSRAVFFPTDPKEIKVDGRDVKTHTAVKIAFPGTLDKHHGESTLLGEDQNRLESDHHINRNYGILNNEHGDSYSSNTHESGGVLAPVFETHPENHHLEMGRITPCNSKSIAEATKHEKFPKGLTHEEIHAAMMHEHECAHGSRETGFYSKKFSEEHLEKVKEHPWVEHAISMMHDSGMHPGDLSKRNMGMYQHPVTGKQHLAIIDYGFSSDIARKYMKARTNSMRATRGY